MPARNVLLLLLLIAAMGGGGCGGGDSTASEEPAATHAALAQEPRSGQIDLLLAIDNDTQEEESNTRVTASYRRHGNGELPSFDATVESIGALNRTSAEFSGALSYTPRRAVLEFDGQRFELKPAALGGAEAVADCERGLRGTAPAQLVEGAGEDGSAKVTGELDVAAAQQVLGALVQRSACGSQLQALPSASVVAEDVGDALGAYGIKSRVEVERGEDETLRRLLLRVFLHPKRAGQDEYDGLLELTVTEGGEGVTIAPPPAALPVGELVKRVGPGRAAQLEAAARAVAGLTWAAIGE